MNDEVKVTRGSVWFTWDDEKAISNWKKHRITFEVASRVFLDEYALVLPDELHSDLEDRKRIIGTVRSNSRRVRVLFVVYVERFKIEQDKTIIRIISARDATNNEKEIYEYNIARQLS
ncbi:MAG: BrnT family toxin [Synergistaceae bacterium]|nr:BrnT family toxin [Synergistaceae bacterium]MBQ9404417.1 BrnT family toxin [Synergistaceae bacterium]MBQ9595350.1 BrnT family toxin [Synergistaceae bacterium]MBR0204380.1 BrnT family toxin [Synergistaceae bacterium]